MSIENGKNWTQESTGKKFTEEEMADELAKRWNPEDDEKPEKNQENEEDLEKKIEEEAKILETNVAEAQSMLKEIGSEKNLEETIKSMDQSKLRQIVDEIEYIFRDVKDDLQKFALFAGTGAVIGVIAYSQIADSGFGNVFTSLNFLKAAGVGAGLGGIVQTVKLSFKTLESVGASLAILIKKKESAQSMEK